HRHTLRLRRNDRGGRIIEQYPNVVEDQVYVEGRQRSVSERNCRRDAVGYEWKQLRRVHGAIACGEYRNGLREQWRCRLALNADLHSLLVVIEKRLGADIERQQVLCSCGRWNCLGNAATWRTLTIVEVHQ